MANITPLPNIIMSIRNQNLSVKACIGEYVDNSFDAGAQQIRLPDLDGVPCYDRRTGETSNLGDQIRAQIAALKARG
jgi:hypothetical protein